MPSWTLSPLLLATLMVSCASSARRPPVSVVVYEADAFRPVDTRRLPEGCRLLATSGPLDQMESERATDDPYRRQRRETAEKGGNVLLVLSQRTVTRPNIDCPSGDPSADCVRRSGSWYRVSFEQYACDADAVKALAELKPEPRRGGITIPLGTPGSKETATPALAPPELKAKILEMMRSGVAPGVMLAYAKGQRLSRKMTAEEIIDWTKSAIPDAVIEAAASR